MNMNMSTIRIQHTKNSKPKHDRLSTYGYWNASDREQPSRQRRTSLFAKTTGLLPINSRLAFRFADHVRSKVATDHLSVWINEHGTLFALNEPYTHLDGGALSDDEYLSIMVPIPLSPYCGRSCTESEILPGTRSYLICKAAHFEQLAILCAKLEFAALEAPQWNIHIGAPI